MKIRLVVSGRGYDAALNLPETFEMADGATVAEALEAVTVLLGNGQTLAPGCLVAVSGRHLGTVARYSDRSLADGDELVLVTPVAGG